MRVAFVAWTPLHLINILNVYRNFYSDSEADLFIYSEFDKASEYYKNIQQLSIFNKVFFVDHKKIGSPILRKLDLITNKNRFFSERIDFYDEMFIQGENYFSKILFSNIKMQNSDIKLNYIEDGIGTYLNDIVFSTSKKTQLKINRYNKYSIFLQDVSTYFVYYPELLSYDPQIVIKIPQIKEYSDLLNEVCLIFGTEKMDTKNKCIFFDQPLLHDGYGINEVEIAEKISELLSSKKEMVVKIHPRGELNRYTYTDTKILNSSLPFEVLLAENEFKSTILISPISTISFSPSMMFDKNLETILLAQLLLNEFSNVSDSKKEVLNKIVWFCKRYNEVSESKIHLPSNWDELRKLVN